MYEQTLYKIIDPIKKTTLSRLNKGKNGNMDTIKNMILSYYQKLVKLVKSMKSKISG